MTRYLLGVSGYSHESAVALINSEGKLVDYCREEYLSRIKSDKSFPKRSIKKLLSQNNIEYCDIDKIPIKTLTNLVFVVNGKEISIYVNGILSKICVLLGTPVFNKNAMYFNHERSSDGYIKKFKYIPYPITDKQVRNMF